MNFTEILKGLSEKIHAQGAAMIDRDGEVVASWSRNSALDMELVGAHYEIILDAANEAASERANLVNSIFISTDAAKVAVMPIKEGYCLVVALDRKAPSGKILAEAAKTIESIKIEMG
jgi:predicted regulator of Ras-like GTPase activity (Roadblock/LC7/MglB family)